MQSGCLGSSMSTRIQEHKAEQLAILFRARQLPVFTFSIPFLEEVVG